MRAILTVLFLLAATLAFGRDIDGRFAQSPNRDWFNGLKNKAGHGCCASADGFRIDAPDWECSELERCRVRLDGGWVDVHPDNLVNGTNRVGYAIVWPVKMSDGTWMVRCFLKGVEI